MAIMVETRRYDNEVMESALQLEPWLIASVATYSPGPQSVLNLARRARPIGLAREAYE